MTVETSFQIIGRTDVNVAIVELEKRKYTYRTAYFPMRSTFAEASVDTLRQGFRVARRPKPWRRVASPARFELTTPGLGILCSIQLSYGDSAESRL